MAEVNHTERAHALLSASGSERWINCPASSRLEEQFPEQETSVYAEEGTLAHELAEIKLRLDLKFMNIDSYRQEAEALRKNPLYYPEMEDEVMVYVNYCKDQFAEAKRKDKHARILIEEKLDLTQWIAEGFGTSDCIVICNEGIEVIDLKFGKGKQVYANENTQLMTYGLGAERVAKRTSTFDKVTLTIVQPRLDHISTWQIAAIRLREWGDEVLKPKAEEAYDGLGEQVAGDHCQYCRAKVKCRALHDIAMESVKKDFTDPQLISDEEVLSVYESVSFISKYLEAVKAHVLKEALGGKQWQGYKLVEGKSNRQWSDESKALEILEENLYERNEIVNSKIKGLGDLEKLLKKANFDKLLGHLIVKPQGAPTLVEETDKRPLFGVAQLQKDFAETTEAESFDDLN
jgi:hypothetical protein